jgi:hypothetical protein
MELVGLPDVLAALPLGVQLAGSVVATILFLLVLRILSNAFPGRAPPVDEGMPFIGGLIKFSKVRRAREKPDMVPTRLWRLPVPYPLHGPAAA